MSKKCSIILLLLVGGVFAALAVSAAPAPPAEPQPSAVPPVTDRESYDRGRAAGLDASLFSPGRFVIYQHPEMRSDQFLLDTTTGTCWKLVQNSADKSTSWERMFRDP